MSYEPTWSLIIACYLFLAGLGGSAFLTSALLRKFCPQAVNMIRIGRIIGPATVIVGLLLLIVDATAGFHNPLRFVFLLGNFGSVMTWGVVFLAVFIVVSLLVALLDLTKHRVPGWLDAVGAVFGLLVGIYTGVLLGACKTFPLWNNALLPVLFLVSAISTGMASVLLAAVFKHPEEFNQVGLLKKFHYIFPCLELFIVIVFLIMLSFDATGAGRESAAKLVCGEYAVAFWFVFIILGLVMPTALETWLLFFAPEEFERSRKAHIISAASDIGVLLGGFALRWLVLLAAVPITLVVPWV